MGLKINLPSAGLLGISGAKDFSWTSVYVGSPTPRTLSENSIFAFGGDAPFTVNLPTTLSDGATIVMKNITAKEVETFTLVADPSAGGDTQTFTLSKEPVGAVDFSEVEGVTITNVGTQVSAVYTAPINDPVEFTATYSAVVVTITPAYIDGEMMSLPVIPGETVELYWIGSHNNEDGTKGTWIHTDISSTLGSGDTITQESADARYLRQGAGITFTDGDARYTQPITEVVVVDNSNRDLESNKINVIGEELTAGELYTLPEGVDGSVIIIKNFDKHTFTLMPASGEKIENQTDGETLEVSDPYIKLTLLYNSTYGWIAI